MKYNVTNRTTSVRSFTSGGRMLKLMGSETERGVELSEDEKKALEATKEFTIKALGDEKTEAVNEAARAQPQQRAPQPRADKEA